MPWIPHPQKSKLTLWTPWLSITTKASPETGDGKGHTSPIQWPNWIRSPRFFRVIRSKNAPFQCCDTMKVRSVTVASNQSFVEGIPRHCEMDYMHVQKSSKIGKQAHQKSNPDIDTPVVLVDVHLAYHVSNADNVSIGSPPFLPSIRAPIGRRRSRFAKCASDDPILIHVRPNIIDKSNKPSLPWAYLGWLVHRQGAESSYQTHRWLDRILEQKRPSHKKLNAY